ncbi:MAG: hypothetical protein IPG91_05290 [Ideonella sp.]|nr:hypothetical protein [Ideonella sp.]
MKQAVSNDVLTERPDDALHDALQAIVRPLARLAVGHGLSFAAAEEIMKRAFVECAADAHPGLPPHRKVSRISTVTGINRREVTRLTRARAAPSPRRPSVASELYARWLTDAAYRDRRGRPKVLRRQGPAPSFETLAQAVTRDVHPRSLLDELLRLRLATLDPATDRVTLAADATPRGDAARLLGFLGDNVGDHLQAAVGNVLAGGEGGGDPHFDQAMFADGVSDETMSWLRQSVRERWGKLLAGMVPELEKRLDEDARHAPPPARRWRLGLYSYDESPPPATVAEAPVETPDEASGTAPRAAPGKKNLRDRKTRS